MGVADERVQPMEGAGSVRGGGASWGRSFSGGRGCSHGSERPPPHAGTPRCPPRPPGAPGAPAPPREEEPKELRVDGPAEAAAALCHPAVPGQRAQPLPGGADPLPRRGPGPGAGGRCPDSHR